jgi:hypothetical protein
LGNQILPYWGLGAEENLGKSSLPVWFRLKWCCLLNSIVYLHYYYLVKSWRITNFCLFVMPGRWIIRVTLHRQLAPRHGSKSSATSHPRRVYDGSMDFDVRTILCVTETINSRRVAWTLNWQRVVPQRLYSLRGVTDDEHGRSADKQQRRRAGHVVVRIDCNSRWHCRYNTTATQVVILTFFNLITAVSSI